jgi:hypothetical protein
MKTILLAVLSLCFTPSVVALSQDALNHAPRKSQAVTGVRLTTIMGTIQEDGDKLRFVTNQRAWNVDNPETLKGHEGHYVHVKAHLHPDTDSIHITEVKVPTAGESRNDDMR